MKRCKITGFCCMLACLVGLAGGSTAAFAADATTQLETGMELKEMPVLTGDQWQTLGPDAKIAFIWGVGHVVTIEEHVMQRHPELARKGFVAKLAEGLRGVPMKNIVQEVDTYYQKNPDDLDLPVMRVVWRQIVKPKLKTGIADRPLIKQDTEQ
jgi:hypothetical protein